MSRDGSEKLGPDQEELRDLLRVEGACEMVALGHHATQPRQLFGLFGGLDPFGDDVEVQGAPGL